MSPRPPFPPAPRKSGKHRLFIGVLLAVVLLGGVISFLTSGGKTTHKAAPRQEVVTITLPPPLPTPPPPKVEPPPPKEEQPKEEEMVEQEPVAEDEPPPADTPPDSPPSEDLSTGIAGNGPDMGLGRAGNGGNGQIGGGGRKGGGSKFGWYAAKVQTAIASALRNNSSTRNASMTLQVRVWPDPNGRITRAQLVGSSGNPAVDQAIRSQVLTGLQLPEPPPADMPVPIVLRITARKPGI